MFDFEKLDVYHKAKSFHTDIRKFITTSRLNAVTKDQLNRASLSIVLNIAEGSGRFSKADRSNFYVVSRSLVFECVAILDILKDEKVIELQDHKKFYDRAEVLSKIIFTMIKNLNS